MDSIVFALGFLALGIAFILASRFLGADRQLPPGPLSLPIVGALLTLRQPLHKHFAKLGKKYGPLVFLKIGMVPHLVVNTADAAEEVLKVKDVEFANRPNSGGFFEIFSFGYKDMVMASYGKSWKTMRRIAGTHLFNNKMMNMSSRSRQLQIQTACSSIHSCCKTGKPVDLRAIVARYLANSLTLALFGKEDMQLVELIDSMSALAVNVNIGELIPALDWLDLHGIHAKMKNELMPRLKSIIEKQFEEHRCKKVAAGDDFVCQDFTDVLVSFEEENATLDDVSIMALLTDLLAAGLDTSKSSLEFALAEVISNPRVLSRAQEELDRVVGRARLVTEADLPSLPYIEAILKEVLRLHPPAPVGFPHVNPNEVMLGSYRIPARTRVMVNIWAIGRDRKHWTDPEIFQPERFLNDSNLSLTGQNFQFIPFSAGRRICVGYPFALRSIPLGLAALLQTFSWSQEQGSKICLEEDCGTVSCRLASALVVVASPRIEERLLI